jgi:hypothetical protein
MYRFLSKHDKTRAKYQKDFNYAPKQNTPFTAPIFREVKNVQ